MTERMLAFLGRLPARQVLLLTAGVFLIVVVLLSTMLRPPISNWRVMSAERLKFQSNGVDKAGLQQVAVQLTGEVLQMEQTATRQSGSTDETVLEVIRSLNQSSARHSVRLGSVVPGVANPFMSFYEIPFSVDVSGRYQDLMRWLHDVESTMPHLSISGIDVSSSGEENIAIRASFNVYQQMEAK